MSFEMESYKTKYHDLIKELIKRDYSIDLRKLEKIIFVMKETNCESVEDWDKIQTYLEKYSEETRKTYPNWFDEVSFDFYVEYLHELRFMEKPLFPEEDMYTITQRVKQKKKQIEEEYLKIMPNEIIKEIKEDSCAYEFKVVME